MENPFKKWFLETQQILESSLFISGKSWKTVLSCEVCHFFSLPDSMKIEREMMYICCYLLLWVACYLCSLFCLSHLQQLLR